MTLALHVSDSNDKKVGNSTWVTTSESTEKNTCLYEQVQTRPPPSINNIRLTIAATCAHARVAARHKQNTAGPRRHAHVTTRSETTLPYYTWHTSHPNKNALGSNSMCSYTLTHIYILMNDIRVIKLKALYRCALIIVRFQTRQTISCHIGTSSTIFESNRKLL